MKDWGAQFRAVGFYPGSGGDTIRFNDDIQWTVDKRGGGNCQNITCRTSNYLANPLSIFSHSSYCVVVHFLPRALTHEVGHALGILRYRFSITVIKTFHRIPSCARTVGRFAKMAL